MGQNGGNVPQGGKVLQFTSAAPRGKEPAKEAGERPAFSGRYQLYVDTQKEFERFGSLPQQMEEEGLDLHSRRLPEARNRACAFMDKALSLHLSGGLTYRQLEIEMTAAQLLASFAFVIKEVIRGAYHKKNYGVFASATLIGKELLDKERRFLSKEIDHPIPSYDETARTEELNWCFNHFAGTPLGGYASEFGRAVKGLEEIRRDARFIIASGKTARNSEEG